MQACQSEEIHCGDGLAMIARIAAQRFPGLVLSFGFLRFLIAAQRLDHR
jgi:hypothetical protein